MEKRNQKKLLTVVYYTSNQEDEAFEKKIREKLLQVIGELPLISVSQKPIRFGFNICVGGVGVSTRNAHRQLQIGALVAKTPFIVSAEADCLYPPEYFAFIPPIKKAYRYTNVWIMSKFTGGFRQKKHSEFAQICGRRYLIKCVDKWLRDRPMWNPVIENDPKPSRILFRKRRHFFSGEIPAISIKTKEGMNWRTRILKDVPSKDRLPYWGKAEDLRKELFRI